MTRLWVCGVLVGCFVLLSQGSSALHAADITVKVRSLDDLTIERRNQEEAKNGKRAASVQITVTNADPKTGGALVFANPIPVPPAASFVTLPIPNDPAVRGVRIVVQDVNGELLTATVDSVQNVAQDITVVMPEAGGAACPPVYVECAPRCRLLRRR
jgi:hypothetical protein